jgi:hypothetical protein
VIGIVITRGETLASVAIVRGVFIATARTQLKSVFSSWGRIAKQSSWRCLAESYCMPISCNTGELHPASTISALLMS